MQKIKQNWWLWPVVICIVVNGPAILLLTTYWPIGLQTIKTLVCLSPNQFLFLLLFFPPAVFCLDLAIRDIRRQLSSDDAPSVVALRSSRLWRHFFKSRLTVVVSGLIVGIAVACADYANTRPAYYSLKPDSAKLAAEHHGNIVASMPKNVSDSDAQQIIEAAKGNAQISKDLMLKLPQTDSTLSEIKKNIDYLIKLTALHSEDTNTTMLLLDGAELTVDTMVVWELVWTVGILAVFRSRHSPTIATMKQLRIAGTRLIVGTGLLTMWIGFRQYNLKESMSVIGGVPDISGPIAGIAIAAMLGLLLVIFYAHGAAWKVAKEASPVFLGLVTWATSNFAFEQSRDAFGLNANWGSLLLLGIVYAVFLAILFMLLTPPEKPGGAPKTNND